MKQEKIKELLEIGNNLVENIDDLLVSEMTIQNRFEIIDNINSVMLYEEMLNNSIKASQVYDIDFITELAIFKEKVKKLQKQAFIVC